MRLSKHSVAAAVTTGENVYTVFFYNGLLPLVHILSAHPTL